MSVIVSAAVELPAAVGEKVTKTRQLAPALRLEPQVVVSPKAPGLEPVNAMLLMLRVSFPVLISVTICASLVVLRIWLAKVRLAGLNETTGPAPMPVRLTDWGLLGALSATVNDALMLPGF